MCGADLYSFRSGPVLIYQYSSLLATAHEPEGCAAAYADLMKYTKYPRTGNYGTEAQYCERLESEAWMCRYAGIVLAVIGGYCLYAAYTGKQGEGASS